MRQAFTSDQRTRLLTAEDRAADLVSKFYVIAPREWDRCRVEVRTLAELDGSEVTDSALAQLLCYTERRAIGERVVEERDLYRICLQDHRILNRAHELETIPIDVLLLYVLTHEYVHVVRFSQHLQRLDLPVRLRAAEEANVDRTARRILRDLDDSRVSDALDRFPLPDI